jgi:hypothetical protein
MYADVSDIFWYEECRLLRCYAVWLLQEPTAVKTSNLTTFGIF